MNNKVVAVLSSHTPSLFWFRMDMMKEFISRGWSVYALANEEEALWKDKFNEQGIEYRHIDVQRNGVNPITDLKTVKSIKKHLAEIRPDKIFTFQAKTVIYGAIAANSLGITEKKHDPVRTTGIQRRETVTCWTWVRRNANRSGIRQED